MREAQAREEQAPAAEPIPAPETAPQPVRGEPAAPQPQPHRGQQRGQHPGKTEATIAALLAQVESKASVALAR